MYWYLVESARTVMLSVRPYRVSSKELLRDVYTTKVRYPVALLRPMALYVYEQITNPRD
jgi:hypothetical protein